MLPVVPHRQALFHRHALDIIRGFPEDVRRSVGKAIWELQQGKALGRPLSKPMPAVAAGVEELRIRDQTGAYRVFYFTRSARGVLVFHAFEKRSQKTPPGEIALGRKRLKEMLDASE
jgi:phage-related protein